MSGYYATRLAGERLRRVYEIAPPRVRQYLEAEIDYVVARMPQDGVVLELGCGYGRVTSRIAAASRPVVGIDTSLDSIALARSLAARDANGPRRAAAFVVMDALHLGFRDACFQAVICVQNGICAFGVDAAALVREAIRVTRSGGRVLFSSYTDAFWPYRLEWFRQQAAERLVGEIDYDRSRDGVIVCRDGFRAGTMRPDDFRRLCDRIHIGSQVTEVDGSSVFCEIERGSES
jgi:SAM-dependent methyltransferase